MTFVVVLGMHRSGTSAVARVLDLMGATIGPPELLDRNWEHTELRDCNRRLLAALGGDWDAPPALEPGWETRADLEPLRSAARHASADLAHASVSVWKDPRTCITLPFWLPILGAGTRFVFVFRHPLEVLASLQARQLPDDRPGTVRFGPAHGLALWERYNHDALAHAAGRPVAVVDWSKFLADPGASVSRLHATLSGFGVPLPGGPGPAIDALDAQRRHHDAGAAFEHPAATRSQRDLWAMLLTLEPSYDAFAIGRPLPEPDAISVELLAAHASERRGRQQFEQLTTSRRALSGELLRRNVDEFKKMLRRARG
jgi:Sulfotransferase family